MRTCSTKDCMLDAVEDGTHCPMHIGDQEFRKRIMHVLGEMEVRFTELNKTLIKLLNDVEKHIAMREKHYEDMEIRVFQISIAQENSIGSQVLKFIRKLRELRGLVK